MAIKHYVNPSLGPRQVASITNVHPSTRKIEAKLKDGGEVSVSVFDIPSFFVWPQVGEQWIIRRDGNYWKLHTRYDTDTEHTFDNLNAGEGKIGADVIKTPTGITLIAIDDSAAKVGQVVTYSSDGKWVPGTGTGGSGGATVAVGTTTTGAPGSDAAVSNSGTSTAVVLDFTIPMGATGGQGLTGATGVVGATLPLTYDSGTQTVAINNATPTTVGAASFASGDFDVTSGAVSIKTGGVDNTQLANNYITINGTNISLGGSVSGLATTSSPTLTGTPLSTTAADDTNTTQIATTAFVVGQASSTAPIVDSSATIGTSLKYARADHVHPTDSTRAPSISPTFTGTITTPLTTGGFVKSVTTTGVLSNGTIAVGDLPTPTSSSDTTINYPTQIVYNNKGQVTSSTAASGTTGTTSTNLVFSTSPILITPSITTSIDSSSASFTAFATPTTLNIGNTTLASTTNIATAAISTGTKTINIGTNSATGSTTNINIGSQAGGSGLNIYSGTSTAAISLGVYGASNLIGINGALTTDINMNSHKITSVTNPTSNQDAATKTYVDKQDHVKLTATTASMTTATLREIGGLILDIIRLLVT